MKIQIKDVFVLLGGKTILNKINLDIADDEQWAIIGNSGSGKTTLARAICQKIFFRGKIEISTKGIKADLPNIFLIEQQHRFKNKSNVENFYYQQRFNSADTEDTITVEEALFFETKNSADINKWSTIFSIDKILKKPLIQLSNGENKRVQLTKAILNTNFSN